MAEQDNDLSFSVEPGTPDSAGDTPVIAGPSAQLGVSIQTEYHGPIPTPKMLEDFGKLDPGIPAKIIEMAVETSHAAANKTNAEAEKDRAEAEAIRASASIARIGQWMVFAIILLLLAGAVFLACQGHDKVAVAFVGAFAVLGLLMWKPGRSK